MMPDPTKVETHKVTDDVYALRAWMPTPFGALAVTSFVIKGPEPIIIDTHMPIARASVLDHMWKLVEPKDVRWVFLTHDDRDHSGNLVPVLEQCPNARFATNMLSMARMSEEFMLPMNRVRLIQAGESLEASGRRFSVVRPPVYDAPGTVALFDASSGVLFSSDCFGAFMATPMNDVRDAIQEDVARGFMGFQAANSPWAHLLSGTKTLTDSIGAIRALSPKYFATTHGPTFDGRQSDMLYKLVSDGAAGPPFQVPTHEQFEQMMAQMAGGPPPGA